LNNNWHKIDHSVLNCNFTQKYLSFWLWRCRSHYERNFRQSIINGIYVFFPTFCKYSCSPPLPWMLMSHYNYSTLAFVCIYVIVSFINKQTQWDQLVIINNHRPSVTTVHQIGHNLFGIILYIFSWNHINLLLYWIILYALGYL